MNPAYYVSSYAAHLRALQQQHGEARAMELLVGDADHWVGMLEYGVLLNLGLKPSDAVIDVGCGTGRLSHRLAQCGHAGFFGGTDLLPEVVAYAARRSDRADWRFAVATAPPLPFPAGAADWVTFYSVFTHILDEDIYLYLQEAKRLLKPGGRIVFSFLDFTVPEHWPVFEQGLAGRGPDALLNRFLSQETIRLWCARLGLRVEHLHPGSEKWIRLSPPLVEYDLSAEFFQSIAVLAPA